MKRSFRRTAALLLSALILLSACLCGCQQEEKVKNFPVALSKTDRSALELCEVYYTDEELDAIYDCAAEEGTASHLNDSYEIDCLRRDEEGCHVIYTGQKKVLVLYFDQQGKWIEQEKKACLIKMLGTAADLKKVKVGSDISVVQKADKNAFYPFLENADLPRVSRHYSEDGYVTVIAYDDSNAVVSIDREIM